MKLGFLLGLLYSDIEEQESLCKELEREDLD